MDTLTAIKMCIDLALIEEEKAGGAEEYEDAERWRTTRKMLLSLAEDQQPADLPEGLGGPTICP